MSQMSLFDCDYTRFAGVMPAVRAAMRRAAGAPDSIGRKGLVDKINLIAGEAEIRLTGGQGRPSLKTHWTNGCPLRTPAIPLPYWPYWSSAGPVRISKRFASSCGPWGWI